MTGQELLRLQESRVFRPTVMDTVINELVPPKDAFLLTDAFLPFKLVDKNLIIDLIQHGAFGRTTPVNLGADHKKIGITGSEYKEHTPGHWREAVEYNEDVLAKAVDPARPTSLWGQGLATKALDLLDLRLNNLIEFITSKIIIEGKYSEARFGVNYTYDPKIPSKLRENVTTTSRWDSGGTWTVAANATPIVDIMEVAILMRRFGIIPEEVIMSAKTAQDFHNTTEVQNKIKSSFQMIGRNADIESQFEVLTGLKMSRDNRLYAEETTFAAASAVADTTLDVVDASEFAANDFITLRNTAGEEEELKITSISSNVITVPSIAFAYKVGDRVTVMKQFLPDNYFVVRGATSDRTNPNNWLSTPSLVKGGNWKNPLPGRYTWTHFQNRVPYKLEIGAGIDGGPKVSRATWMTVKTVA